MQAIKATSALMLIALFLGLAGKATAQVEGEQYARIKSDRVNLRARPEGDAEVVAQAMTDERLRVQEVQDLWVRVEPPERVDLWVHRDFVKDGVSVGDKVNVRAGPGINFTVVGQYTRGETVAVREPLGEWLKVAPSNSTLWVSRDLVEILFPARPAEPAPSPVVAELPPAGPLPAQAVSEPLPANVTAPAPSGPGLAPGAEPPSDLKLVPLEGQGRFVQRVGELKPTAYVFGRPSKYRLARREGTQYVTISYVRGNSAQLKTLLNETLILSGREYWVQGVRQPLLVLERIERPAR